MSRDSRIPHWLKGQPIQNFGDSLSEVFLNALADGHSSDPPRRNKTGRDYDVIHLIGSCLETGLIKKDLEYVRDTGPRKIAYWGCGLRQEVPLEPEVLAHCVFLGVRGPLTRDCLELPKTTALGDPGLLMPYIYTPRAHEESAGRTLCIPHFNDDQSDKKLLSISGCEAVLRPNIANGVSHTFRLIDAICSAKFVLAGALHAAIIAYAYKIPFAYFNSGFIDIPFKWADFAASIHMPCCFVRTAEEGARVYEQQSGEYQMPPLADLLDQCPLRPTARLRKKVRATASRSASVAVANYAAPNNAIHEALSLERADGLFVFEPTAAQIVNCPPCRYISYASTVIDESGRIVLRLSGGNANAMSDGITEGYSIRTPDAFERTASGQTVHIRVLARARSTKSNSAAVGRLGIAYSTNDVGNSGWRWFNLSSQWVVHEMQYSVPPMKDGNGDFIGLLPGDATESDIEIGVVVAVVV